MTLPQATFVAVPPPTDGLLLAFGDARRRRNSKAGVTALGVAVAIASALSFLAPPGQALVQEPLPPAQGAVLTGIPAPEQPGQRLTPARRPPSSTVPPREAVSGGPTAGTPPRLSTAPVRHTEPAVTSGSCLSGRRIACLFIGTPQSAGGTSVRASACPSAVSVTVESSRPSLVAFPLSPSVTVGTGSCDIAE